MRKILPHPYLSATLFGIWLVLTGSASLGTMLLALVLAVLIPLATSRYWPERTPRVRPFALAAYVGMVLWDVVVASAQVARVVLFMPSAKIQSAWITVPIDLPCAEARARLAGTITLTPGTLTADFAEDASALLIHALHAPDPDAVRDEIKQRYEARLKRIFM